MTRIERKLLVGLLVVIGLALGVAWAATAAGPVNPTQAQWTAPTTNDDPPIFSPLTDLASYRVYLAVGATQPVFPGTAWGVIQIVPAAGPAPAPNTVVNMTLPSIPVDGQKYLLVTAVDTAGNESKASPVVPLVINRQAPSPPSGVLVQWTGTTCVLGWTPSDGASRYVVARGASTTPWIAVASGTATNATIPWRAGVTEYAVWSVFPNGSALKSPSVWTWR